MLDDPETAQYTHTLTVTGRLGGLYQCTVANSKPSQASTQFTVQGEAEVQSNLHFTCPVYHLHYAVLKVDYVCVVRINIIDGIEPLYDESSVHTVYIILQ